MILNCKGIEILENLKKNDTRSTEILETLAEVPQRASALRRCSPIRSREENLEDG